MATGYQAFDACFRRRVYRATAWGLSAGGLPGWRDLHPSAYGHAAGEVVRARAITVLRQNRHSDDDLLTVKVKIMA